MTTETNQPTPQPSVQERVRAFILEAGTEGWDHAWYISIILQMTCLASVHPVVGKKKSPRGMRAWFSPHCAISSALVSFRCLVLDVHSSLDVAK